MVCRSDMILRVTLVNRSVYNAASNFRGAMRSVTKNRATENRTVSPLLRRKDRCKCFVLIVMLDAKLALVSKALEEANTKNRAAWTKLDNERSSLNEYLAFSTPGKPIRTYALDEQDLADRSLTVDPAHRRRL
ncbi:hypothetical protein CLF_112987 [Clonorchis sinensis]|uniref:Uncharacterized protein n=1 Tax=Clonorchis sinensis TaxID=79923 RepID=G7YXE7_CLOSI|nr:hypothetical protein CLF_112987 [Clonorchis sinensis]